MTNTEIILMGKSNLMATWTCLIAKGIILTARSTASNKMCTSRDLVMGAAVAVDSVNKTFEFA
jgi:hypothetical protein